MASTNLTVKPNTFNELPDTQVQSLKEGIAAGKFTNSQDLLAGLESIMV